jgi:hypothetical protein
MTVANGHADATIHRSGGQLTDRRQSSLADPASRDSNP